MRVAPLYYVNFRCLAFVGRSRDTDSSQDRKIERHMPGTNEGPSGATASGSLAMRKLDTGRHDLAGRHSAYRFGCLSRLD